MYWNDPFTPTAKVVGRHGRFALLGVALLLGCDTAVAPEAESRTPVLAASIMPTGTFTEVAEPEPYGRFNGKEYVRVTGRFIGATEQGDYRVPFEIVVPQGASFGNGTVLIEPPHFLQRFAGRDDYLGPDFLFGQGYRYASVGWSGFGQSILDPTATDVFIAGGQDDEIVVQFVNALKYSDEGRALIGSAERYYGYGFSQTSWLMHRLLRSPHGAGLFDFTMLNATWWAGGGFQGAYTPVTGIGKVVVVQAEADLIISDGRVLRDAAAEDDTYRVYEVAGSAHIPDVPANHDNPVFGPAIRGTNPADWPAIARAGFVAGDLWNREGTPPAASVFIDDAAPGVIDPVYGFATGVARDHDLNALGGVRLPAVELGVGWFRAAEPTPPLAFLTGSYEPRSCDPDEDGGVRFENHGAYVRAVGEAVDLLVKGGLMLTDDATARKRDAARSDIGSPGSCTP